MATVLTTVLLQYGETGQGGTTQKRFEAMQGNLHLPTVCKYFKLANVELDGVVPLVGPDGFTYRTFPPDATVRVSGDPLPGAAAGLGQAGAEPDAARGGELRKFVGFVEGENGKKSAVVVIHPTGVATYSHGSHQTWKVHDKKTVMIPVGEDAAGFRPVQAEVIEVDHRHDFILLHMERASLGPTVGLATDGEGYSLHGFSSLVADQLSVRHGRVLSTAVSVKREWIYGDACTGLGDSGGAVFSEKSGYLIGMAIARDHDHRAAIIVPANLLLHNYKKLVPAPQEDEEGQEIEDVMRGD